MKKTLSIMLLVATLAMVLVGCSKVTCVECGEKKAGKSREILGQKVDVCNDCWKEFEDAMDEASDALDELSDALGDISF